MKIIFIIILLSLLWSKGYAQLMIDDFTGYILGDLGTQGGWVQNGSGTDIQISNSNPITYPGFWSSGANYITISNTNGIDPYKTFSGQSTASTFTVWYSFLVNISSAASGEYFLTLRNTSNTNYGGRIFVQNASGNLQFGIDKSSATGTYSTTNFNFNETYLLVIKYKSNSGSGNDSMYFWVNPALLNEPNINTALLADVDVTDPSWGTVVNALMIHQRSTNSPIGSIDGIRIGNTWLDGVLPVELSAFSAIVLDNAVKLNWRTETEVNNFGFEIERSVINPKSGIQNQQFGIIGFVQGNGNSNSPKNYSYLDERINAGKYSYRLKQIDTNGKFEYSKIIEIDFSSPAKFELSQNYPNPFNPGTTIRFTLPKSGDVKLSVYNMLGEQVAVLVNEFREAGIHTINFNAMELNSGVYVYNIESNGIIQSQKMILVK